jgi:hypothetical protein
MNRYTAFFAAFSIFLMASFISCDKMKGNDGKEDTGKPAIKLEDDTISIKEFEDYYYTQNKLVLNLGKEEIDEMATNPMAQNHPTLSRKKFADYIISRILLFNKAMDDDTVDREELETVIELNKYNSVATYYLLEKLQDEINVTEQEVEQFYNQNRQMFQGVALNDQVIARIRQQIFMKKFEMKSNEFILNLIAENKVNREGLKQYLKNKTAEAKTESPAEEKPVEEDTATQ